MGTNYYLKTDICHVPAPGEPDDVWWLGFDCGHSWDLTPSLARLTAHHRYGTYRDQEYVTSETRSLAEQAAVAGA